MKFLATTSCTFLILCNSFLSQTEWEQPGVTASSLLLPPFNLGATAGRYISGWPWRWIQSFQFCFQHRELNINYLIMFKIKENLDVIEGKWPKSSCPELMCSRFSFCVKTSQMNDSTKINFVHQIFHWWKDLEMIFELGPFPWGSLESQT